MVLVAACLESKTSTGGPGGNVWWLLLWGGPDPRPNVLATALCRHSVPDQEEGEGAEEWSAARGTCTCTYMCDSCLLCLLWFCGLPVAVLHITVPAASISYMCLTLASFLHVM